MDIPRYYSALIAHLYRCGKALSARRGAGIKYGIARPRIGGTGSKHVIVGGRLIDDSADGEGNVYGGGSQAEVVKTNNGNGNTHVILTGNAHVKGNVYGGGNQADVQGNTNVELR